MQPNTNYCLLLCSIILLLVLTQNFRDGPESKQMNQILELYSHDCSPQQNTYDLFQNLFNFDKQLFANEFEVSQRIETLLTLEDSEGYILIDILNNKPWEFIKTIFIWILVFFTSLIIVIFYYSRFCQEKLMDVLQKIVGTFNQIPIIAKLNFERTKIPIILVLIACLSLNYIGFQDIETIPCNAVKFIKLIVEGGSNREQSEWQWKGFEGLQSSLYIAEQNLTKYIDISNEQFNRVNFTKINLLYQDLILTNRQKDQNIQYQTHQQMDSYFQQNSLITFMKIGENNSNLDILKRIEPQDGIILNHYRELLSYINSTYQIGNQLYRQKDQIIKQIKSTQDRLYYEKTYLNNQIDKLYFKLSSSIDSVYDIGLIGITISYSFLIILLICSKCVSAIYSNNEEIGIKPCKKLICLNSLFLLIYVTVGSIICFWCMVLQEGCQYVNLITSNKVSYQGSNLFNGDMKPLFEQCLFDNSLIDEKYNISDLLQFSSKFQLAINQLTLKIEGYPKHYLKSMQQLKQNQLILEDIVTLRLIDYENYRPQNHFNVKDTLQNGFLNCTGDQFVEFKESCLPNLEYYDPLLNKTYPNKEGPLCMQTSIFTSTHFKRIEKRLHNCSEYEFVLNFLKEQIYNWKGVYDHESQIITKFQTLNEDINHQISLITQYFSLIDNFLRPLLKIKECINCQFMKTQLKKVTDSFCLTTFNYFYIQELVMLTFMILILFFSILYFCWVIRKERKYQSQNNYRLGSTITDQIVGQTPHQLELVGGDFQSVSKQ